jgi:uncharacterized protein (TIGR00251 family)
MQIHIKVKPGSKLNHLLKDAAGNWVMKVKAPPVDGKANDEVIRFLSEILKIPKSAITLKRGQSNSYKTLDVGILSEEEIRRRMEGGVRGSGE